MKIGILTFHDADNYGAVLQAYALKETINKIEEDVEIINYKQPYIMNDYKLFSLNKNKYIKSLISNIVHLHARMRKKIKFNNFRQKYMNISKENYYDSSKIQGKDVYIVGSDQIWNGELNLYDTTFFLDFCKGPEKTISYAASIGNDNLSDNQVRYLRDNISNIEHISVREENVVKILEGMTNKEIFHVLDPTLLAEKNIWDKFINKSKIKSQYLLIYRLSDNDEVLKIADSVSKKLNLKVKYINESMKKNPYGFENIQNVGPKEFITLINGASFIVTNSFHGTAFSIVFNKDFITVPHKVSGSRMIGLLRLLKLNDRILVSNDEINNNYNLNVDYKIPNNILKKEKEKSLNFLHNSIKDTGK